MHKSKVSATLLIPVILFLAPVLQTTPRADMTVTQEVTVQTGDKRISSGGTVYWTAMKKRDYDSHGNITITDLNTRTMTVLDPKEKTYAVITFDEMKEREASLPEKLRPIREAKLSVQETGETRTLDGYPCERLVLKVGPTAITVWVTKQIKVDPALVEFNTKFLELTKEVKMLNIQAQMQAAFSQRNVYPYLTIIEMPLLKGDKQIVRSRAKEVSYEKIDPSVFAIPEGYKEEAPPEAPPPK
ncbi:MAG: DUF4412 domain-containing protein [bacterium]|nr:DUF4412 domain-containing protein [bacterium]